MFFVNERLKLMFNSFLNATMNEVEFRSIISKQPIIHNWVKTAAVKKLSLCFKGSRNCDGWKFCGFKSDPYGSGNK